MSTLTDQLPCDLASERLILGSVILDHASHAEVFSLLKADDFSLHDHQQLFAVMVAMDAAGLAIDRITIAGRLHDLKQLQAVGGFSYLISLDEGLPLLPNIESYIRNVLEKSSLRKIIYTAQNLMNRCMVANTEASELIAVADQTLMQINRNQSGISEALTAGQIIEKGGGLDKFLHPDPGIRTPWVRLTEITGGYRPQELSVIAGNPGMGKSAMAIQTAMRVAEDGLGVMIFSLEMSRTSIIKRMACYRARVDSQRFQLGFMNPAERERIRKAVHEMSAWPLWIAEYGVSTVSGIRAALRAKRASKQDVFMLVIDYLQILQVVGKSKSRNEEVSDLTRSLKLLAMEEKVNIQLLSQLSRDNKKERRAPELQDLRDSGSIEQDADSVAFVWRPEMLHRDHEDLRGQADLILAKQRNGPTGKIELTWLGQFTAFENRTEDFREE